MAEGPVLVVVEAFEDGRPILEAMLADGYRVPSGSVLPDDPWDLADRRWVVTAHVADDAQQAAAVLAAARGVSAVLASTDAGRRRQLIADLRRIATVEVVSHSDPVDPTRRLDPDARRLLELLAAGATLPEAAREAMLSVRTAERRLAEARRSLGVRTTAEAVAALVDPTA